MKLFADFENEKGAKVAAAKEQNTKAEATEKEAKSALAKPKDNKDKAMQLMASLSTLKSEASTIELEMGLLKTSCSSRRVNTRLRLIEALMSTKLNYCPCPPDSVSRLL